MRIIVLFIRLIIKYIIIWNANQVMSEEIKDMSEFIEMLNKLSLKQILALQHVLSQLALAHVLKDSKPDKVEIIKPSPLII